MSSKKNIDRLFQEKFKDFDVKPDPKVWQNINSKLNNKEEDKPIAIIPLWLKLSGIAVSLLLLLFLGQSVFNTIDKSNTPSIVDTEKIINEENKTANNPALKDKNTIEQNNQKQNKEEEINKTDKLEATIVNQSNATKNTSNTVISNNKLNSNYNLSKNNITTSKNKSSFKNNTNNNSVAGQEDSQNIIVNKTAPTNQGITTKDSYNTKNLNANNVKTPSNSIINDAKNNNTVVLTESNLIKNSAEDNTVVPTKSIEDAIAENKNINDLIEKEEEVNNRWNVNANIAPVYYNSFGEGSHIHEQFNKNNKSGEVNTSYGVKVGYALNDKLTVRSGINRLNLSYDTDNVIVYQNVSTSPTPKDLRNIDFNPSNSQSINIISSNSLLLGINNTSLIKNVGLSQRISYYELPVEVEYALVNTKFNLNVIGGVSTFVLEDNKLVSEYDGYKIDIGKANNINNVSFSANFGIGLNYKFSESVIFNFEPTFKYQLNAFENTSGSFNPYIIGVYTGFSYKF